MFVVFYMYQFRESDYGNKMKQISRRFLCWTRLLIENFCAEETGKSFC